MNGTGVIELRVDTGAKLNAGFLGSSGFLVSDTVLVDSASGALNSEEPNLIGSVGFSLLKLVPNEMACVLVEAPNLMLEFGLAWKRSDLGSNVDVGFSAGVVVGLAPGLGVMQQAHFSLTSALATRQVSQVHLEAIVPGF